jgi:predicted phage terminase large subunit-like protein
LNRKWAGSKFMIPSEDVVKEFFKDRTMDKVERANNAVPYLYSRQVLINKEIANKENLVAECMGFPKGKHDDFVDTLIDAIKMVHKRNVSILDVL